MNEYIILAKLEQIIKKLDELETAVNDRKNNPQTKITVIGNRPQSKTNVTGVDSAESFEL